MTEPREQDLSSAEFAVNELKSRFEQVFSGLCATINNPAEAVLSARENGYANFRLLNPALFSGTPSGHVEYLKGSDGEDQVVKVNLGETRPHARSAPVDCVSVFERFLSVERFSQEQKVVNKDQRITVDAKTGTVSINNDFYIPREKKKWYQRTSPDVFPIDSASVRGDYSTGGQLEKITITFFNKGSLPDERPTATYIDKDGKWERSSSVSSVFKRQLVAGDDRLGSVALIKRHYGEEGFVKLEEHGVSLPVADDVKIDRDGIGNTFFPVKVVSHKGETCDFRAAFPPKVDVLQALEYASKNQQIPLS